MTQAFRWMATQERVRGAFKAYSEAAGDTLSYPRNWCENATAQELAAVGIETYTLPAPPPPPEPGTHEYALRHTLEPWQFFAMLDLLGIRATVDGAIDAITDDAARIVARNRLDRANSFSRNNPLFEMLDEAVGMTPAQIDAAWAQAVSLAGGN